MSHSALCLWKKKYLYEKLRREVTLEEVHMLCEFLSFSSPLETMAWIERSPPEEIEEKLRQARKRRRRVGQEIEETPLLYIS
ncbi:MAG: hypothetical protein QXG52_08845 [Candidatus Caldarchaeum sp.]